ncbi:MAG: glycosyltransferase [Microcystaceae cyanobacterium]
MVNQELLKQLEQQDSLISERHQKLLETQISLTNNPSDYIYCNKRNSPSYYVPCDTPEEVIPNLQDSETDEQESIVPNIFPISNAGFSSILEKTELKLSLAEEVQQISFTYYEKPDVTIIVPVYNQLEYTLRCLKALMYQKMENLTFQVIVADDTSTDQTQDLIPLISGLDYIRNPENYGFLLSCNNASQQVRGKYIVFLNNDTVPLENWLQELIAPFLNDPQGKTGLVGSMLLYPNGMLQEAGGLIWNDGSGWNFGRMQDPNRCEYNYVRETDYCSGASIALTTQLWQQLKGFDPLFAPAYYEDTDIAFRVRQAGYKVIFNPFSRIIHFEGISSGTDLNSGTKHYQEVNKPKFLERWRDILMEHPEPPQSLETAKYHRQTHHRLLWIDATMITPDQDAGSVYVLNHFKVMKECGWGITFMPENFFYDDCYTQKLQKMGIECIFPPYWQSVEDYLKHHGAEFDVIVLCRAYTAVNNIDLVRMYAPQAKIIFSTIDLHFLRQTRKVDVLGNLEKTRLIEEASNTFKNEISVMSRSDLTILVSKQEEILIQSLLPSAQVAVIPLIQEIPDCQVEIEQRKDIGFIGGFRHPPNVDAVHFFASSVLPLILEEIPDCRFVVAGSHIPDEIANLASEHIIIKGFVPNIKDFFDSIRISVAPLRFGAGMKGKVVSSLSYGVPVVATSIATEGMDIVHQQDGMICDQPEAMAQAIIDCYTSPTTWNRLSINGLKLAQTNFSLEAVGLKIQTMLNQLVDTE